jgi:outer membrane immunogenic protein
MKAPAAMPSVYNWTGFYAGLNAGYAWGKSDPTLQDVSFFEGSPQVAATPSLKPKGFIGGGQLGYNWQSGIWVLGAELDFSGLDVKASERVAGLFVQGVNIFNTTFSSRYDWLFTARARLGVTIAPNSLLYATGGLAVTHAKDSVSTLNTANGVTADWSESETLVGGTVGAGVEYAFAPNWSVKAEYLYSKFKDSSPPLTGSNVGGVISGPVAEFDHNLHVVRAGINYKF